MQVFVEVADRASLTAAADALDMSRAMVARYLVSLEQWLGVRLLHRTTRRVSLTDAGDEALERVKQALALMHEVQAVAGARRAQPKGKLRVTASSSFAQSHVAAAIVDFLTRYPLAQIELIATERTVNLVEERIDVAIRIGKRVDDGLIARPLGRCRSVVCASPAYVRRSGRPKVPEDLTRHRCITHVYVGSNEFALVRDAKTYRIPVRAIFESNDAAVTRAAALAGGGIALLPTYFVSEDLARGDLVRLLPDYEPHPLVIYAAYLSRAHQTMLLRLLIDFLVTRFGGDVPPWDREPRSA